MSDRPVRDAAIGAGIGIAAGPALLAAVTIGVKAACARWPWVHAHLVLIAIGLFLAVTGIAWAVFELRIARLRRP